jgi:hypothetical protein
MRMIRRIMAIAGALAPAIALAGAAPASAATAALSDPAGDIAYCQADLLQASAMFRDGTISFTATTACDVDAANDPAWKNGAGNVGWVLETDGDPATDYVADIGNAGNGVFADVVHVENGDRTVTCRVTPDVGPHTFAMSFPRSCIGDVDNFRYAAAAQWDESPEAPSCTCPSDYTPDRDFSVVVRNSHGDGYWMVGRTGDTYAFGAAPYLGNSPSAAEVVDIEGTPSGNGYWAVDRTGRVQAHGDAMAPPAGAPALNVGERITAMSATRSGRGYWLFSDRGRVFPYGDAIKFGDLAAKKLNGPILDAIITPTGQGYYLVGSDGGIFTFGDAEFLGSMGATKLNAPVQSLVPDPDGRGYWLVASDGGIFAFDAPFYGSMGDVTLNKPITGMVGFGAGYLMVAEDGGVFTFGDTPFLGSLGDHPPAQPIVSLASLP